MGRQPHFGGTPRALCRAGYFAVTLPYIPAA